MADSWPLGPEHLAMLNGVKETGPVFMPLLQKCKDCGLDVQNEIDTLQHQLDHATAIKRNFFPDQP